MAGNWLIQLGSSVAVSLFTAKIVQFATNKVAGFNPSYASAFLVSFLTLVIATVLGGLGAVSGLGRSPLGMVLGLLATFLIGAALYGWLLRHPASGPIGMRKGVLVSLVQLVVVGALLVGLMVVFTAFK